MNKIKLLAVSAACFAAGLIALRATDAGAQYRRLHNSYCTAYYEDQTDIRHAKYGMKNFGAGGGTVMCPIPSDGYLAHHNISKINMHGYDGASMSARVCTQVYYTSSYDCGNPTSGSGTNFNVTMGDLSALSDPYGFPYVSVYLGYSSIFYGYYIEGSQ